MSYKKKKEYDYRALEDALKNLPHSVKGGSIIDLCFHYFWPLIGSYTKESEGNYFEKQKVFKLKEYIENNDSFVSNETFVVDPEKSTQQKVFIFQTDRTQALVDGMNNDTYVTQHQSYLKEPHKKWCKLTHDEYEEIISFCDACLDALYQCDITLTSFDKTYLVKLVSQISIDFLYIYYKVLLNQNKISLMVFHADNHPPFIYWVLAAKLHNVPTMMLQHGLDCEPYFLDDAYADYLAVWGQTRADRYLQYSRLLPKEIRVTGNPEYDRLIHKQKAVKPSSENGTIKIAYFGRPHGLEKTYFHFRNSMQGTMILNDLLTVSLAYPSVEIICKLHPYDSMTEVESFLASHDAINIQLSTQPIEEILAEVVGVISEDSTSAIEAAMFGKPVMLVHYEDSKPIVNLEKYDEGMTVQKQQEFIPTFKRLMERVDQTYMKWQTPYQEMIVDYFGVQDGKATERVIDFINDIVTKHVEKCEELTYCSVVTKNYLQYADALYQSLLKENGNVVYKVLVIDNEDVNENDFNFDIIGLSDIDVPMIEHMLIYYSAFELSCVLKPFFIQHLFNKKHEKVVFLDSDIFITGSFLELSQLLDNHHVMFTPHYNISPPFDGMYPDEPQIALYGVLNGGFWAMRRSSKSLRVLEWFMKELTVYGFHEPEKGMTGDQPMITVAAILFNDDITLLKEPQYNVAYWNMHERVISYRNGQFYADRKECVFFHISRFRETEPDKFTIDQDHRITTANYPVTKNIISSYLQYLQIANKKYQQYSYGFNSFMNQEFDQKNRRDYFQLVKSKILHYLNKNDQLSIVFVADGKFWEMDNGSKARLVSLVKYLKNLYDVKILFLGRIKKEDWDKISELSLKENTVGLLNIPKIWKTKYVKEIHSTYEPISKYVANKNITDHFYTYVKTHHIDVCVVEYVRWTHLTEYLEEDTITILDMHDILYKRCEKFKAQGIPHWIDVSKEQEYALYKKFDYLLAIQEDEVCELHGDGIDNVIYAPYGLVVQRQELHSTVKKITYIAGKNEVNDAAILWFVKNVWIYYSQLYPDTRLHVYGTVCATVEKFSSNGLILHGKIDNLQEAYENSDLVINPIQYGGGLKIKSVEALANGLPLVTTLEGASGMGEGVNEAFMLANDADDFLTMMIGISESKSLRKKMSAQASSFAQKHFSEKKTYQHLIQVLESIQRKEH